jgi:hypothetical protein
MLSRTTYIQKELNTHVAYKILRKWRLSMELRGLYQQMYWFKWKKYISNDWICFEPLVSGFEILTRMGKLSGRLQRLLNAAKKPSGNKIPKFSCKFRNWTRSLARSGAYEEFYQLVYNGVYYAESQQKCLRNISLPYSGLKNKPVIEPWWSKQVARKSMCTGSDTSFRNAGYIPKKWTALYPNRWNYFEPLRIVPFVNFVHRSEFY